VVPIRPSHLAAVAATGALIAGCAGPPEPGDWGRFRYFDQVPGEPPLSLLPPASDRNANEYVLFGAIDDTDVEAWIGDAAGGWTDACAGLKKSTEFGVHGWIGHANDAHWYWSSDLFVLLRGRTCTEILNFDPASSASL